LAKTLQEWIDTDVQSVKDKPMRWLAQHYFFRDPIRPIYSDASLFFAPADGIILCDLSVAADESIVDIKGKSYSVRDAMRDPTYERDSLVIGTFMTFYDVHINRVPYAGRLAWKELEPIDTHNLPMLDMEKNLLAELRIATEGASYLRQNQRMLNRVYAPSLRQNYYVLQIADYDVDCITPFELKQNRHFAQNQRFSQIRFGSQVDLIVPLSDSHRHTVLVDAGTHVEAGLDPVVRADPLL
jgi:phosphatidylserine decarboxylase